MSLNLASVNLKEIIKILILKDIQDEIKELLWNGSITVFSIRRLSTVTALVGDKEEKF